MSEADRAVEVVERWAKWIAFESEDMDGPAGAREQFYMDRDLVLSVLRSLITPPTEE